MSAYDNHPSLLKTVDMMRGQLNPAIPPCSEYQRKLGINRHCTAMRANDVTFTPKSGGTLHLTPKVWIMYTLFVMPNILAKEMEISAALWAMWPNTLHLY